MILARAAARFARCPPPAAAALLQQHLQQRRTKADLRKINAINRAASLRYKRKKLRQGGGGGPGGALSDGGSGALSAPAVAVDDDDDLPYWGNFELGIHSVVIPEPEQQFDRLGPRAFLASKLVRNNESFVQRNIRNQMQNTGVLKEEYKQLRGREKFVKRATARRARRRFERFKADKRSVARLMYLIERRKAMEKEFIPLEDEIEDPYVGEEGWWEWHLAGEGKKVEAQLELLRSGDRAGEQEGAAAQRGGAVVRTKQVEFR